MLVNNHHLIINLSVLFAKPTGIATYASQVTPFLQELNPTLLTSQDHPGFNCHNVPANMTPLQGRTGHIRRLLWTQFQLPRIYRNLQGSLLFSPLPEAPIASDCRLVVMVHDLIPLRFPRLTSPLLPYFRYYVPQVLKNSLHIVCNSQSTAKDIVDFYKISSKKITTIPLGYDPEHFKVQKSNKTGSYFLYLGRQDAYKNLHRLIAAFAALTDRSNYELYLVGSRDHRYSAQLLELSKKLGVDKQVKFLDYVSYSELPLLLAGAIALVFPSLWEGFGIPALEAMACGTPVITSNISGLPEVVGDAGILVNPYSVSSIAEAMKNVANNAQIRRDMSHKSLKRAAEFSWQKTGEKTKEILEQYI